jgi:hypothetical protein
MIILQSDLENRLSGGVHKSAIRAAKAQQLEAYINKKQNKELEVRAPFLSVGFVNWILADAMNSNDVQ